MIDNNYVLAGTFLTSLCLSKSNLYRYIGKKTKENYLSRLANNSMEKGSLPT